jgi:hypothetical protein
VPRNRDGYRGHEESWRNDDSPIHRNTQSDKPRARPALRRRSERVKYYPEDVPIIVTEGEKATDALLAAKIPAVGTVTGASGTPGDEAPSVLSGRNVVLLPDADDPGRNGSRALLRAFACTSGKMRPRRRRRGGQPGCPVRTKSGIRALFAEMAHTSVLQADSTLLIPDSFSIVVGSEPSSTLTLGLGLGLAVKRFPELPKFSRGCTVHPLLYGPTISLTGVPTPTTYLMPVETTTAPAPAPVGTCFKASGHASAILQEYHLLVAY